MQKISLKVEQQNGAIALNFDEIRDRLSEGLEIYKSMVFTEETKKEAKATVAELRKLKKAINDKKLEVKKSFMIPYTEFEAKVKELDALVEEPITFINTQVEEFEKRRIEEKRQLINQIYSENIADMEEYVPLAKIYDVKWENASVNKKSIEEAVKSHVENVKRDIITLKSMKSDSVSKAIAVYKTNLSLADAIAYINCYEEERAEILKREEECRKQEEIKSEGIKEALPEEAKIPDIVRRGDFIPLSNENDIEDFITYKVKADPFQIAQLEAAMREYGIEYRRG